MRSAVSGGVPLRLRTTRRTFDERLVLGGLVVVFLCRAVIAHATVLPWQGPDEPGHFSRVYQVAFPRALEADIHRDILRSMVRQRWWDLYEDSPPAQLESLAEVQGLGISTLAQPLYYSLAGIALRLSRPADLETAYSHARVVSVALSVLTLLFGWAGTRVLFGPEIALGSTAIGTLHPQFLLTAVSINADALLFTCGALVWWQACRAITGQRRDFSVALMLVFAGAAMIAKRWGLVLVGIAAVVAAASYFVGRASFRRRDLILMSVVGLAAAATVAGSWVLFQDQVVYWKYFLIDVFTIRRPLDQMAASEALGHLRMTVDYFWLIAGWLRFQPPDLWIWVSRVLVIGGMAGAAVVFVKSPGDRTRHALAWFFVIVQVIAMLVVVFWITFPSAPQPRYLFPVFAPITVLLYIGLRRLVPTPALHYWPVMLVVVLALMDVTGFTTVHIPTYVQ